MEGGHQYNKSLLRGWVIAGVPARVVASRRWQQQRAQPGPTISFRDAFACDNGSIAFVTRLRRWPPSPVHKLQLHAVHRVSIFGCAVNQLQLDHLRWTTKDCATSEPSRHLAGACSGARRCLYGSVDGVIISGMRQMLNVNIGGDVHVMFLTFFTS